MKNRRKPSVAGPSSNDKFKPGETVKLTAVALQYGWPDKAGVVIECGNSCVKVRLKGETVEPAWYPQEFFEVAE